MQRSMPTDASDVCERRRKMFGSVFITTFLNKCRRFSATKASIRIHTCYRQLPVSKFTCRTLQLSPYCTPSSRRRCSHLFGRGNHGYLSTMTAASSSSSDHLAVDHDEENKMFFINLGGSEKAVLEYEIIGPDAVNLYHTGVPVSHRGKGIAKIIAKAALDHFASQGTNMKLTCTYLQKYFQENPVPLYKDRILDL